MIYLVLAILSSALVSITMRLSESKTKYPFGLLCANYLACSVIAFLYCGSTSVTFPLVGFSAFSGLFYLGSFVLMQWNIQNNGVVMSSTFMKLGVLVPIVFSMLMFAEMPNLMQALGLILALFSIVLLKGKQGQKKLMLVPLVVLMIAGGFTDFTSKLFEQFFQNDLKDMYLFLNFLFAMLFCFGMVIMKKQKLTWSEMIYGVLVGIPNYFSARFLLLALGSIEAVIAYPTYSVATILVVSLAGYVLFRERLSSRQVQVMGLILVSLILLNL